MPCYRSRNEGMKLFNLTAFATPFRDFCGIYHQRGILRPALPGGC